MFTKRNWGIALGTILLILLVVLMIQTFGESSNDEVAIFYSPHPDDETLSMGATIAQHVREGYDTHIVLFTQGAASVAIHTVNERLKAEGKTPLTIQDFKDARVREFKQAVTHLGVKKENVHIFDYEDKNLQIEDVIHVMKQFESDYPGAHHHAFSYEDPHPDHATTGYALHKLSEDGEVKNARYFVPRYVDMEHLGDLIDVSSDDIPNVLSALDAYNIWDPDNGYYAIGYQSVTNAMNMMKEDPRNRVHE